MRWVKQNIMAGTGKGPRQVKGSVAECAACKCRNWFLFQVEGQSHGHLQCVRCGEVYCPDDGQCRDLAWDPIPASDSDQAGGG